MADLGYHAIPGELMLSALRRVENGEKADIVYAELWANAEHERVDGDRAQREPSWWMSFCDGELPEGQQFLGVCVVRAPDEFSAVTKTHLLGINPGGEIQMARIPAEEEGRIHENAYDKLWSEDDLQDMDLL